MKKQSICRTLAQYKKQSFRDTLFRNAIEQADEDVFLETAFQLINLRRNAGLTQGDLAKKVKVSQQAIARLESMKYKGHSLKTLQRIATALHKKVQIKFV
jgi:DNA-binding XRE family transcriptional regulator